jgi:hypothetical protein
MQVLPQHTGNLFKGLEVCLCHALRPHDANYQNICENYLDYSTTIMHMPHSPCRWNSVDVYFLPYRQSSRVTLMK